MIDLFLISPPSVYSPSTATQRGDASSSSSSSAFGEHPTITFPAPHPFSSRPPSNRLDRAAPTNVIPMSSPPSASENTLSEPLVTPAASAQHDCSEGPDLFCGKQRRHPARDQLLHQDVQQAPSPSRAESPTAHQWSSNPTSSLALKKTPKIPLEKVARSDFSHSPQLSERDSIFATHYLPSDTAHNTPQLLPVQDAAHDELQITQIPDIENASASPISTSKVLPHRPHGDASHMEVDIHRNHPLRSPSFLASPAIPHSSLLSIRSDVDWEKPQEAEGKSQTPPWESFPPLQKFVSGGAKPGDSSFDYDFIPGTLSDAPSSRNSIVLPPGDDFSADHSDMTSYQLSEESPRDGPREPKLERSSSRSRRGRGGRVENSIEANLTNAEPTSHVRSRKSSHYLGLFKENTTSPDRKRRDDRGKKIDEPLDPYDTPDAIHEEPPYGWEHHDLGNQRQAEPLPSSRDAGLRTSKSMSHLSFVDAPLIEPPSVDEAYGHPHGDTITKNHYRALPHTLLEEIRNFHLTPGGARGTSFSKSIPTQFSEGGQDYTPKDSSDRSSPPSDENQEHRRCSDYEDEGTEQISSAVYFPHERVTVDQFQSFPDDRADERQFNASASQEGHVLVPEPGAIPGEQEVSHVDISLRSKNDSRILHGDLQDLQPPLEELNENSLGTVSEHGCDSTGESELASADELSGREEESSLTDDLDMTPTATPTQRQRIPRPRRKHEAGPVGAVELKPYRHQVGGHTTVFRFSRRAVCKQLNNRENEFYERIERRHPEMLMFLPRYIGVLNVTFSKNPKRPKPHAEGQTSIEAANGNAHDAKHSERASVGDTKPAEPAEPQRIFSQSQVTGIIPKVILENNRHIIPAGLFSRSERPRTADEATLSKHRFSNGNRPSMHEKQALPGSLEDRRVAPPPLKRHNISWGATTVNRKLQEQVLREVFSPPAIHQHRRHARGHLTMPRMSSDSGRRRANLSEDQTASSRRAAPEQSEPPRSSAIDITKQSSEGGRGLSSSASTALDAPHKGLEKIRTEEPQPPRASSLNRTRQVRRRHSGSGLQRRGSMDSGKTGDLMFFDDDGYGGDREDEIFSMEGDPSMAPNRLAKEAPEQPPLEIVAPEDSQADEHVPSDPPPSLPVRLEVKDENPFHLPANPKEAQTRKDERVQFFLLLEDLTAGMSKPCVLDLKMGTRQYGIEADDKKRKSQRRKCQSTTSQQLGVRLCGMQTWNIKKQEYAFEDKYFGRDLKSGREFQDALTRFLYDGVSYTSVAKKIPVILEKIGKLENMIRKLKSYRLYASSLLILYDGDPADPDTMPKTDTQSPVKRNPLHRRTSDDGRGNLDVHLKIVDFANCVTGEDVLPPDTRCPPQHPDDIDRGYLRGLRTLRMYFQRILKETMHDDYVERGEGEAIALGSRTSGNEASSDRYLDEGVMEDDPGEVSF
ncbi:hypothetical protein AWENTII_007832 [Aspergillus wentii]|nr:hypothetical protein MW887_002171 [Aspergillus wentii]